MEDILHHQSSKFDEDLGRLRSNVLKMGGLVENQVATAIEAYGACDLAAIKEIVARDQEINTLEIVIDDETCGQMVLLGHGIPFYISACTLHT